MIDNTPFRNNPDKDFIVLAWGMGLVQASCNPFKKDRALKGVDLGEIKNEVLSKFEPLLKGITVSFGTLKRVSEISAEEGSVGFTYKDLIALYGNSPSFNIGAGEKNCRNSKNRPKQSPQLKKSEYFTEVIINTPKNTKSQSLL